MLTSTTLQSLLLNLFDPQLLHQVLCLALDLALDLGQENDALRSQTLVHL